MTEQATVSLTERTNIHAIPASRGRKRKKPGADHIIQESLLTPWVKALPMTEYESQEQRLHDEIVHFYHYLRPSDEERRGRELVVAKVTEIIDRRFHHCRVIPFGSVALDLSLPGGDVDLVIETADVQNDGQRKSALYHLSSMLRNSGIAASTFVIGRATVPILTMRCGNEVGSFDFDISINALDGVSLISVMEGYLNTMPPLRYLIMVVKTFLASRDLGSAASGGLSSYSATCLVISFLQHNPGNRPKRFLDHPLEEESLGHLLLDFFDYYASRFPYETSYVSITQGRLFPKTLKGWERPCVPGSLSIECLVNPDKDIAKATGKIAKIRAAFREAHTLLQLYPMSLSHGNILGSILGLRERRVLWRESIQNLVQSGALERELARVAIPAPWYRTDQRTNNAQVRESRDRRALPDRRGYDTPPHFSSPYRRNGNLSQAAPPNDIDSENFHADHSAHQPAKRRRL